MDGKKIKKLDSALVHASGKIRVLKALEWPLDSEKIFLDNWRRGNLRLPEVTLQRQDLTSSITSLEAIVACCDKNQAVEKFLADTAQSYADCAHMLSHIGTPEFTRYSTKIYGRPDTVYKLQGQSPVDGAIFFLNVTDKLIGNADFPPAISDISATAFAGWLKAEVDEFFEKDCVEVVLDPNLASKALAGATRIRLRGSALFSSQDNQLLYHEAFIHTATLLNGKKQSNLRSLGLGAPRTTRTQEGLAVMAEILTNAIDITRLRRIALRVIAVKKALDGADFVEIFKFFLDAGQPPEESVRSAQRIFRGGDVRGGVVFTKDSVYLEGLLEVHTFMRVAIRDNRPGLIRNLFAGRLTMGDALRLDPFFRTGWLQQPLYVPVWASDMTKLAAAISFAVYLSNIKLEKVYLERAIEFEDEVHI
ncbi:DUF1704 domain-containing protein [Fulvivirgaceae bacterium PWU4]|uniref:DUF1704 domain-containing protein n=1 Tax=Chryseosolibacter histidini TaxID=2782349 RepID=A0AAP2DLE2_9BACT|nr:flavohemoglobin expression-modulating QEGLA motif protein [Chryseosolibacter histidini]MBT1698396.1 DUF1704 domain-containing protein [Chryseosolibacter histidini]